MPQSAETLYVLVHLVSIVGLLFALWAMGGLLVRVFGGDALFRFAFGCLIGTAALFLLASLGLYRPLPMALVVLLLSVLGLWIERPVLGVRVTKARTETQGQSTGEARKEGESRLGRGLMLVTIAACSLVVLAEALNPMLSWDADVYHLTVPKLYLAHGGFYRIPYNVYSNWPLNLELIYGLALLRGPVVAKAFHLALGIAAAGVTYRLARSAGASQRSSYCGVVAVALFLGNPVVIEQVATAYVDCGYAFFFGLAGLLLLDRAEQDGVLQPNWKLRTTKFGRLPDSTWIAVGLLAGMVAGIKLSGFFAAISLSLVALFALPRRRLSAAATVAIVAFLVLLPWLTKTWIFTGNPVYPLFYGVLGGPEWSEALADKHASWQRSMGMGRSVGDYLLLPVRIVLYGGRGYQNFAGNVSPIWLTMLPISILGAARDRRTRILLLLSGLYFILWASTSQQARFLIPILPFLAAASARSVVELFALITRPLSPGLRARSLAGLRVALSLALAGQLISASVPKFQRAPRIARNLLEYGSGLDARVTHPVYNFMNQNLPADARVLMFNHNRGFSLERPYIADSFFEASQIEATFNWQESREQVEATLQELGVTHVLLAKIDLGLRFSESLVDFLADQNAARVIYESPDGRYSVIELLIPTGTSSARPPL